MSTKSIEQFFAGKTFVIPGFQRDYAWSASNVDDLFEDVEEALDAGGGHYLGTFILSQTSTSAPVHVVDGQQRLTTLTMLLDALIDVVEDAAHKQHYLNTFIEHPVTGPKFQLLGDNKAFFHKLLRDQKPPADSDGQDRLLKVHLWIRYRVHALLQKGGQELVKSWLQCISQLEVLEFIEPNEGKAIRMFQSVNDRGVPLAKMDIVKSLLVYYSNRYLNGALDDFVAIRFGAAFRSLSRIKRLGREDGYQIRLINRDTFREDDVLRYHYFAFDGSAFSISAGVDYSATAETVLEVFLKPSLRRMRTNPAKLESFIRCYAEDLTGFFVGLEGLVAKTREDKANYLLFVTQDMAATLYPLVIRLHLKGWLSLPGGDDDTRTLQQLIELVDLRVFKLRGTNPQADIAHLTRELPNLTVAQVASKLRDFCGHFMPDSLMASRIVDEDMYRNFGTQRMLLEVEEESRKALNAEPLQMVELVALNKTGLTVEHILPQEPNFHLAAYGFVDPAEYLQHKHKLGNLMLLEGPLNSACNNRTVEDKMSSDRLYGDSRMSSVKTLVARHAGQAGFNKTSIEDRGKAIALLVTRRWPLKFVA